VIRVRWIALATVAAAAGSTAPARALQDAEPTWPDTVAGRFGRESFDAVKADTDEPMRRFQTAHRSPKSLEEQSAGGYGASNASPSRRTISTQKYCGSESVTSRRISSHQWDGFRDFSAKCSTHQSRDQIFP